MFSQSAFIAITSSLCPFIPSHDHQGEHSTDGIKHIVICLVINTAEQHTHESKE